MRSCGRHRCKRRCCDPESTCQPCEVMCNSTLNCRHHKCPMPCHTGPCYPCQKMVESSNPDCRIQLVMEGIIRDAVRSNNKSMKEHGRGAEKYSKINPRLSIDDTFADRSYSFRVNWMKDEKLLHQLKKDNIDIELFQCEIKRETNEKSNKTIKSKLLLFLQSNPIQIIIALLVLVDAGIVIAEIILEIHSLKNKIEAHEEQLHETIIFMRETFRINVSDEKIEINLMENILEQLRNKSALQKRCQSPMPGDTHLPPSVVPASDHRYLRRHRRSSPVIASGANKTNHKVKDKKHRSHTLHVVSETLHYASIIILGLFVLEVGLKISCVGLKFFKAKFEVVDAVVIVTSFVADIIIVRIGSQEISVMIIFLLWRIVRVINGLLMHEKQRDEFRIALQKKARRVSEMKVDQLTIQNEMQEKHIMALDEVAKESGVSELIIKRCRPKYIQYSKDQTNNPLKSIAAMTTGFMGGLVGAQPSNKEINRYAASYSPSCTPRNRSPLSQKRLKLTTATTAPTNLTRTLDTADSNNIKSNSATPNNKVSVFFQENPETQPNRRNKSVNYAETWCSSINSVFDNNSFDNGDTNNDSNDSGNIITLTNHPEPDKMFNKSVNELENSLNLDDSLVCCSSPMKDFTSTKIVSPYIDDVMIESSDNSASCRISHGSSLDRAPYATNAKEIEAAKTLSKDTVIFRCFHQHQNRSGSDYTLLPCGHKNNCDCDDNSSSSSRAVDYV